ncbi:MAG: hypothetical protein HY819_17145 [Acidobacteria bacterium]|nr:hypothetical protein [Acidobacteriota bacterium]
MTTQYFDRQIKNNPTKRHGSKYQAKWIFLTIGVACIITYSFVLAAQNHFAALELGYKSEELKRQRDKLELEQRKLTLEMERKLSPQRLDTKAQEQGLSLPVAKPTKEETQKTSD